MKENLVNINFKLSIELEVVIKSFKSAAFTIKEISSI